MNTNPAVTRFVDRVKATTPPATLTKVEEEGDSYNFSTISRNHYACESGTTTHVIIEKDGKIGCACGDMTYRCQGTNVCKHITAFLGLNTPPQIPASGELITKLMIMGWVGGKDSLHPAELSHIPSAKDDSGGDDTPDTATEHYECPKCGVAITIDSAKLRDWKLTHMDNCTGKKPEAKSIRDAPDPLYEPEDPQCPDPVRAELPEPPADDYSSCKNVPQFPPLSPGPIPSNLASALCNMQKIDLRAVTDSANPFHNAKYVDLASVWAAIRKPLTDNGLAVIQTTEPYPQGVSVITTLVHISGETFASRLSCEVPQSKPDKNGQSKPNIKGLGSTITYLRRYSLAAMVGVAPVDDDGESAMGR